MQLARETSALLAQQPGAEHVLVHLGLQLELEQGHRLVEARVPRHVHEMADAFGGREVVGEVFLRERDERILCGRPSSTAAAEEKAHHSGAPSSATMSCSSLLRAPSKCPTPARSVIRNCAMSGVAGRS